MTAAPIKRSTLRWLVGVAVVSFLGALLLSVFGPDMAPPPSGGASSYSSSALGHRALAALLERLDIPVIASRYSSAERASQRGLLVLAEPLDCEPGTPRGDALEAMLDSATDVLLVLPKWSATRSDQSDGHVETITLRTEDEALAPLRSLLSTVVLARRSVSAGRPLALTRTLDGLAPTFPLPLAQFVYSQELEPIVSDGQAILLGQVKGVGERVLVLSDPDVLCNAGLHVGDNAPFVIAAIEVLRPTGGAVVIDETIHGHERKPSIWHELLSFPLVLLVVHAALTVMLLLWAGMGRFGAPQRAGPPRAPGRQSLVGNTAELLRYRGRMGSTLAKYLGGAVSDVRRALRAPKGLSDAELLAWLERTGARRGATDRVSALHELVASPRASGSSAAHMLAVAGRIHRWRTEILHGPASRTRPS